MLFKRRKRKSFLAHAKNFVWPSMGWRRTYDYMKHRILRLPSSNHSIAIGLAAGCVVSWTPTFPFQILQAFIFCRIFKANFPAAVLGTLFGNPWSFPILFAVSYYVGQFFLDITGLEDFFIMLAGGTEIFKQDGFGIQRFLPTIVGGYIMAIVSFPVFYYSFYYMIKGARAARVKVSTKVHNMIDHRKEQRDKK